MKKSLLALAVLGAFASAASAQSSVTLSGIVDAGVTRKGTATGYDWAMGGSQGGYNSFTLSGREDLGGGMAAFFSLNHRFSINNGAVNVTGNTAAVTNPTAPAVSTPNSPTYFWRNTAVGLAGPFGDVRLGRIMMPLQDMNGGFDPFATGTVGSTHTGGIAATIRANNAIYYRSPSLGGLTFHAAIAAGEGQLAGEAGSPALKYFTPTPVPSTTGAGQRPWETRLQERPIGFNVRYAAGPLNVGVAYDRNAGDLKTTGVYGSFDLGVAKLMAQFEKGDNFTSAAGTTAEDVKAFSFGATVPLGPVLVRTGYLRINSDLSARDGSKFGFGGDYNLSKRTNLYATVGKASGDRFTVAERKAQFDLGVTHRF